ncbi:MAG TPA: outer membrane beta-barrel protein [Candidatus Polarisedimenticolia bacterium]|nr:outer membrane beta-barrel protein [Candidatus Polarisedimenticolia bacterium]
MLRVRTAILALAALAVFASAPAMAQDNVGRLFITVDWVSPLGDDNITINNVQDAVQGSDDFGYELGYEGRFNKVFGLEGSFLAGSNDFELDNNGTELGSLDQRAITLALNFHIIPAKYFDLWLAPVASWYSFGELDNIPDGDNLNDEWGYGAQVGFDIWLGKVVGIDGGVRYVKLDISNGNQSVAFDPVIARLGLAFRFGQH